MKYIHQGFINIRLFHWNGFNRNRLITLTSPSHSLYLSKAASKSLENIDILLSQYLGTNSPVCHTLVNPNFEKKSASSQFQTYVRICLRGFIRERFVIFTTTVPFLILIRGFIRIFCKYWYSSKPKSSLQISGFSCSFKNYLQLSQISLT